MTTNAILATENLKQMPSRQSRPVTEDHSAADERRWNAVLARDAARAAGFADFEPDACLVNQYIPGARLTLHQDRDESDLSAPIVSVSLGLPATFLFGGNARTDKQRRAPLQHGDVVVWGGPARLHHHGVLAVKDGYHELLGSRRLNLTFRRAS